MTTATTESPQVYADLSPSQLIEQSLQRGESTLSVWPEQGTFSTAGLGALAGDLGIRTLTHPEVTLAAGETHTLVRHFAVGPDIATTEEARWTQQGETLAEVSGSVTSGGSGVAGVRVWFVNEEDVAGFAMSEAPAFVVIIKMTFRKSTDLPL